jgi:4'-phosphopantetheinyl transferase
VEDRELHCWCVRITAQSHAGAALYATLSAEERDRSARFRSDQDRLRFIVAHGALREVLGRDLGIPPGDIRFEYNEYGKPALRPELGRRSKFNLSHSADLALIALSADRDVGVDVEPIRPASEYAEIARCDPRAFCELWTKREAYVKARGEGLTDGPIEFSERWSFYSFEPVPGYIGTLAAEGSDWTVTVQDWLPYPASDQPTV